jgi:hypothetical protein
MKRFTLPKKADRITHWDLKKKKQGNANLQTLTQSKYSVQESMIKLGLLLLLLPFNSV